MISFSKLFVLFVLLHCSSVPDDLILLLLAVLQNVGFVILNGTDPTQILQRSEQPIFSPELDWEIQGLTPNVVFAEGWFPLGSDTFLMFYGAADTYVGAAVVSVSF